MKFVIDRSKWRCGGWLGASASRHGEGATLLLNEEGYMCCLGFMVNQLGVAEAGIKGHTAPCYIPDTYRHGLDLSLLVGGACDHTLFTNEAMCINDEPALSFESREQGLRDRLAKEGHEVEFVSEYTRPSEANAISDPVST